MHYLSVYGIEGFRSFQGILNGKHLYAPEKIPHIDPEVLVEKDYFLRLQEIVSPYCDNHPKLKDILAVIPSNIGNLYAISSNYSVWRPKNHFSLLGEYLLAGLFECFLPKEIQKQLYFFACTDGSAESVKEAFLLEHKSILLSKSICAIPQQDEYTKIYLSDDNNVKKMLLEQQTLFLDSRNFFRIVGHIATIIEALYRTEDTRQRFYNDLVSLVIPADDAEFLLAAYYLSKSKLPIKNIYAISTEHRMIHNFITKGEFKITDVRAYEELEYSLDRILFEAARGSADKVVFWKKELLRNGMFKIDSKAFASFEKFKSVFVSKNHVDAIQKEFNQATDLKETKISLYAYKLSQEVQEHILAFDSRNPDMVSNIKAEIYPSFTAKDIK